MDYIKLFETHSEYETYINSENKKLPNLSYCEDNDCVHFNPWVETRLIVQYNVEDDSEPTYLYCYFDGVLAIHEFDKIEIDNIDVSPSSLDSAEGKYQLSNGIHMVKYTLKNPTTIGSELFFQCTSLTSVTIPDSVTSIGNSAFSGCGFTSLIIPNSVTSIGYGAFGSCESLTSINIPNSVTSISESAFDSCSSLTSVTIGNSVTTIGADAFTGCESLTNITSLATTAPTISNSTFLNVKTNGTLTVPTGSNGYDVWMGTGNYYLGKYNWTKVEQ
jgi:hypothetical protein